MGAPLTSISCPSSIPFTYDPDRLVAMATAELAMLIDAATRAMDELADKEADRVNFGYVFGQLARVTRHKMEAITSCNHAANLIDADPEEDDEDDDDEDMRQPAPLDLPIVGKGGAI